MKNVMIVSRQGNAVALGEGVKIQKSANGVFMPSLLALKEVLVAIPTEPAETVCIHLMDIVQGIASGSAVEYVKTGKTGTGTQLSAEEVQAFKEIYELYAQRILNVRFELVKYIRKNDVANQNLKRQAYDELALYEKSVGATGRTSGGYAQPTTTVVDPDKALREAFDAQIKDAMMAGNMELVKQIMEMRKSLAEPQVVSGTNNNTNASAPTFEINNNQGVQAPVESSEVVSPQDEDEPIKFDNAGGEMPAL